MNRRTLLGGILTVPALLVPTVAVAKEAERESPPGGSLPLQVSLVGGGRYSRDDVRRLIDDIETALGGTTC